MSPASTQKIDILVGISIWPSSRASIYFCCFCLTDKKVEPDSQHLNLDPHCFQEHLYYRTLVDCYKGVLFFLLLPHSIFFCFVLTFQSVSASGQKLCPCFYLLKSLFWLCTSFASEMHDWQWMSLKMEGYVCCISNKCHSTLNLNNHGIRQSHENFTKKTPHNRFSLVTHAINERAPCTEAIFLAGRTNHIKRV